MLVAWVLVGTVVYLVYRYYSKKNRYWEERGVPFLKPWPLVGNTLHVATFTQSLGQFFQEVYRTTRQKYVGVYQLTEPILVVNDLDLIEKILVKDFSYFVNRDVPVNKEVSDIEAGLFALRDTEWRGVRYKLIPAFSTGKLKKIFENMLSCASTLESYMDSQASDKADLKEFSTIFSLDCIGNCVFGIDVSKERDRNSTFRKMGRSIFELTTLDYVRFLIVSTLPNLATKLGLTFFSKQVGTYFSSVIRQTIQHRLDSDVKRNDFIQLLVQLKQMGSIEYHTKDLEDKYLELDFEPTAEVIEMTDPLLISQAFLFLTAGFDGLSMTMLFCLYELAKHPEHQETLRREISQQVTKGGFTYDTVKNMTFLDKCLYETLRMYPLSPFLFRQCGKEYDLGDGVTIDPGIKVVIPVLGLHYDPSHYPEPEEFRPDRWDEATLQHTVTNFAYLPFGAGPRICLGMRFALVELKVGLATVIHRYSLGLHQQSQGPVKMKAKSFITSPEKTLYFKLTKLTDESIISSEN